MRLHKNQDGFTLVELAVVILITSIIIFFASGMLLSVSNLFFANKDRSESAQLGDAVLSYISQELIYGRDVVIFADRDDADGVQTTSYGLTVTDGRLYFQDKDFYGEDFYQGRTVQFTAAAAGSYQLDLSVSVLDKDGNELYNTASTIKVLNMELQGKSIVDSASGGINPYVTFDRPAAG